ncbi:MAG: hypothetical protein ABIN05_02310 [candidate division WOR-3 bacterium]
MAKEFSTKQKVFRFVEEFLREKKEGAYYSDIINYLKEKLPDVPVNTLHGSLWDFRQMIINDEKKEVIIPERGFYILSKYYQKETSDQKKSQKIKEEDFYESFADYLVNELEECTKTIALGGKKFQDKWGTPDVFGIYKFSEADPIRPPLEIISAEIKTDISQLITAFGQACAYKIFSHKVYLVIPRQAESEISRLESLCLKFGIGLIIFNNEDIDNPEYQIRTRAIKTEPDYFYVNLYIQKLSNDIKKLLS